MHPWYDGYWWQWTVQNILPNPILWIAAAAGVWLFRDRIGRRLSGWWHKHHGPRVRAEIDSLKDHVMQQVTASHAALLKSVERRHAEILDRVDTQHESLKAHITSRTEAPAPPPLPARQATTRKGPTHG